MGDFTNFTVRGGLDFGGSKIINGMYKDHRSEWTPCQILLSYNTIQ